ALDAREGAGEGGHRLARACEHHADRVERRATHLRARGLWTVSELRSDDELGETLRGGGHGETIANASRGRKAGTISARGPSPSRDASAARPRAPGGGPPGADRL